MAAFYVIYAFAFATQALAQIVSVTLAEVAYNGNWEGTINDTHRYSKEPGDSILYQFQGSGISYISALNPKGGLATITVDGESAQVDESVNITANSVPTLKVLYTKSGLNPTQIHTFQLVVGGNGQFGGPYTEFYGLSVDQGTATAASSAPADQSSNTPAISSTSGASGGSGHSNNTAVIVGGVLGAFIIGILAAGAGIYLFWRRRLATAATNRQRPSDLEAKAAASDAGVSSHSSGAALNSIYSPATELPSSGVCFTNPFGPSTAPSSTTSSATLNATPALSRGRAPPAPLSNVSPYSPVSEEANARFMAAEVTTSHDPPPRYPETPAHVNSAIPNTTGGTGRLVRDAKGARGVGMA